MRYVWLVAAEETAIALADDMFAPVTYPRGDAVVVASASVTVAPTVAATVGAAYVRAAVETASVPPAICDVKL